MAKTKKYRGKLKTIYGGRSVAGRDTLPLSILKGMTPQQHCEKLIAERGGGRFARVSDSEDVCYLPYCGYFGCNPEGAEYSYHYETHDTPPKIELTSETVFTLPANRQRTTIGVGESVIVSANIDVTWQVSSNLVTVDEQNSQKILITALDKAGSVTVTAKTEHNTKSITFSIIEPNKLKLIKVNEVHTHNVLDAGFTAKFVLLPAHVNFQKVYIRERESLAHGGTGLLAEGNGQPHGQYQNGYSQWLPAPTYQAGIGTIVKDANEEEPDFVYGAQNEFCPTNIPNSAIYYDIQFEWKLKDQTKPHNLTTLKQSTIISSNGYTITRKDDVSITFHYSEPSKNTGTIQSRLARILKPKHKC